VMQIWQKDNSGAKKKTRRENEISLLRTLAGFHRCSIRATCHGPAAARKKVEPGE
jgi:hypothetical protein